MVNIFTYHPGFAYSLNCYFGIKVLLRSAAFAVREGSELSVAISFRGGFSLTEGETKRLASPEAPD
jgi:hypothetical protein